MSFSDSLSKNGSESKEEIKQTTYSSSSYVPKSTYGDLLEKPYKPKPLNSDISEMISDSLKNKYKDTSIIDLTEFEPVKNIIYKPNLNFNKQPKQTTLDSVLFIHSNSTLGSDRNNLNDFQNKLLHGSQRNPDPPVNKKSLIPGLEKIKPRVLPDSFMKSKPKTTNEESELQNLRKWTQTLVPSKRVSDKELEDMIKKREKKSNEEENKEILQKYNHKTFNVNDLIKKSEKEKEKMQEEKVSAEELNDKQRKYIEKMRDSKTVQVFQGLTEEEILERDKAVREMNKNNTQEFFASLLSIDLYKQNGKTDSPKILTSFKHGGEYINCFMPAFFEEVKGEIISAVTQNNMSNCWTVSVGVFKSKDGVDFLDFEEESQKKISGNIHADDLIMLYKLNEENQSWKFHQNFNMWEHKPSYFLAFVEKVKENNQIIFRVLNGVVDYLFEGNINSRVKVNVFVIDSCTTILREFKMIRLSEFVELADYVYNPMRSLLFNHLSSNRWVSVLSRYFNESQIEAICAAASVTKGVFLLQGPPGTGKTHTILGILSTLFMKRRDARVLICAPSNSAIDEIAKRVVTETLFDINGSPLKTLKPVRIVSQNHNLFDLREIKKPDTKEMPEEVKSIALNTLVSQKMNNLDSVIELENIKQTKEKLDKLDESIKNCRGEGNSSKLKILYEQKAQLTQVSFKQKSSNKRALEKLRDLECSIVKESNIVFTTLSGAASKELENSNSNFDYVIIDEACQSVELSSLIPFRYNSQVVILIGDPKQLPATTFSQSSSSNNYTRSLFERLMEGGCKVQMLEIQYRMMKEICEFPSNYFYEGRLSTGTTFDLERAPSWIKTFGPLMVNLLSSRESRSDAETSLSNTPECEFIGKLYANLQQVHRQSLSIGIITPYKKQVRIIKEYLDRFFRDSWKDDVEVNTIDGFQGREKDVIVFSAVRSGESIGFLADSRRVNVALTRAKFALWVVGSRACLERNRCWSEFIKFCDINGKVVNCKEFSEVAEKFEVKDCGVRKEKKNQFVPVMRKFEEVREEKTTAPSREKKSNEKPFGFRGENTEKITAVKKQSDDKLFLDIICRKK